MLFILHIFVQYHSWEGLRTMFVCMLLILQIFMQIPLKGELQDQAEKHRAELVERLADVDEQIGELFLMEEPIDAETLQAGIRRATIALKFVPIFMGRWEFGNLDCHKKLTTNSSKSNLLILARMNCYGCYRFQHDSILSLWLMSPFYDAEHSQQVATP